MHMNAVLARTSKGLRQQSLRQLLADNRILSQDEVVDRMLGLGFQVTQSSISRDFKELGVAKIDGRYSVAPSNQGFSLARFVVSGDSAGDHLFVVKTQSGWAVAVSDAIDYQEMEGVVGTVAGENTIMVATKNVAVHARILEFLKTL